LEQILQLSPIGKPYQWFCKHLLPCVVGAKLWHKKHNKELIETIATCSDEGFALLTVENNYKRWMAMARWHVANDNLAPDDRAPKQFPGSLYTNSGLSKNNGHSCCLQGWAREGFLRFNELYTLVGRNRPHLVRFENELLHMWQSESKNDNPHCPVTATETEEDIFPANHLVGLARPGNQVAHESNDESK
jgi:hypothetical protein